MFGLIGAGVRRLMYCLGANDDFSTLQICFSGWREELSDRKAKLDMQKPFATWLVRWAGEILTKYSPGKDGKTAYERCKGKQAKGTGCRHGKGKGA